MLPIEEQIEQQPDGSSQRDESGGLLTGDLGVVVLRALLEAGVGYVVSSWRDRPTPIDAAIDDARDRVLAARGVVLRRLRSLSALEPIIAAPIGGITGEPPRGAVVFGGRRGLRPALERFVEVASSGAVVGFTFDEDALRIQDAIVIDPEPTAPGIARAIDQAFAASHAAGRPAIVVLRERALGMRGTMRTRADRSPADAARQDADTRTDHVEPAAAIAAAGLLDVRVGTAPTQRRAMYVAGPLLVTVERALAQVAADVDALGQRLRLDDIAVIASRAVGVLPTSGSVADQILRDADDVLVLGVGAATLADRLAASGIESVDAHAIDPGTVRGELLTAAIARWLARQDDESLRAALDEVADRRTSNVRGSTSVPRERVPSRSEVLHRAVSPTVAAGLALAQGVIGVPGRMDAEWPTYRTDTGVPLTVAPAETFAAHGIGCAAPGTGPGVVLVTGSAGGVMEAAGSAGASIEHVDGSSPRAIGRAVATACRAQRATWHVVVVGEVQRIAAPRHATFGMDPDLAGTERIALAAVPTAATALVAMDDELADGPTVIALDRPEALAALDQVRDLSPATWDLERRPTSSRTARAAWSLRRRMVRAAAGVEL
ncbi:MAG: hypothetical protein KDC46_13645 [Thermoleophilia bacterium]|nr:hypothetical protein [Thermoleophilia bacterium]